MLKFIYIWNNKILIHFCISLDFLYERIHVPTECHGIAEKLFEIFLCCCGTSSLSPSLDLCQFNPVYKTQVSFLARNFNVIFCWSRRQYLSHEFFLQNSILYYATFLCLIYALHFLPISVFLMYHPNKGKLPAEWACIRLCISFLNSVDDK
jgi:hypothetical protein